MKAAQRRIKIPIRQIIKPGSRILLSAPVVQEVITISFPRPRASSLQPIRIVVIPFFSDSHPVLPSLRKTNKLIFLSSLRITGLVVFENR